MEIESTVSKGSGYRERLNLDTDLINLKLLDNLNGIWNIYNRIRNIIIRSINGNIRNSLDIVHWNLGGRRWENKTQDIQAFVDEFNPDAAFISEANIYKEVEDYRLQIDGYIITPTKSLESKGCSRLSLLARENFEFKLE